MADRGRRHRDASGGRGRPSSKSSDHDSAAEDVNRVWLTATRQHRPFVTFKAGMTIDARVAAVDGTSRWITSPESRADVHQLRARIDVMMVGIGTVLADDPLLTVRGADGAPVADQPLRVVVDSRGRTPVDAKVRNADAATLIATAADYGGVDRVDLSALLADLYRQGRRHVLLEGGPRLATAMLDAGLVDEIVVYVAPLILGAGRAMLEGGVGGDPGGRAPRATSIGRPLRPGRSAALRSHFVTTVSTLITRMTRSALSGGGCWPALPYRRPSRT